MSDHRIEKQRSRYDKKVAEFLKQLKKKAPDLVEPAKHIFLVVWLIFELYEGRPVDLGIVEDQEKILDQELEK